ncbi:MAG: hypothetical protein SPJ77_02720 [Eubacteriales bacterium]|nr:hypothetical protein [Eubacteriales bacterium]
MKEPSKCSCRCGKKRLLASALMLVVAALAIVAVIIAAVAASDADSRPYRAEFSRRTDVFTEETTSRSSVTTSGSDSETAEEETEKAPAGLTEGAFVCTLTMEKTAWEVSETPKITLEFGLTDDSYGEGSLRLRLYCADFYLSDSIFIEEYTFDLHGFEGKNAPDRAELSLMRGSFTEKGAEDETSVSDVPSEFAFGKLYLSFEFIPDEGNTVFGYDDWYEDEDDDMIDEADTEGFWVGGFWCAYSVTPNEIAFARRDVDSGDFFAERVIKQYRSGKLDDAELCRAYYFLAFGDCTYISATSPISTGSTLLGYYSKTLRAIAREPVSDEEILALVAKTGPYPTEHDDSLGVSQTRARELAMLILGVLKNQEVISADEYERELDSLKNEGNFVTSPPEFNSAFRKYRKLIEENVFTHG